MPADAPADVRLAVAVARRLDQARQPLSYREAGTATGVSHQTIHKIIHGNTWPNLHTIATLEIKLGTRLWGDEHLPEKVKRRRRRWQD